MTTIAKFINEIVIEDPDTHGVIHLAVYKHQNGGMFAIDSSFITQVLCDNADEDETQDLLIHDMFADMDEPKQLYLYE
jgi:hypothetical protein